MLIVRACVLAGLGVVILGNAGCMRYRSVPVAEAPKLSAQNVPPSGEIVVKDVDGQRVRIDSFSIVDVGIERCQQMRNGGPYCYDDYVRFRAPVYIARTDGVLRVVPNESDRRAPGIYLFPDVRHVTIGERSDSRTWIVVGTAIIAGVAAGAATAIGVSRSFPDQSGWYEGYGYPMIFLPFFAAGAAAGVSLLITVPLTRDLGTEE